MNYNPDSNPISLVSRLMIDIGKLLFLYEKKSSARSDSEKEEYYDMVEDILRHTPVYDTITNLLKRERVEVGSISTTDMRMLQNRENRKSLSRHQAA